MKASYRLAMVAGSTAIADEVLSLITQIYGDIIAVKPLIAADQYSEQDADLFICFTTLLADMVKKIPAYKLLGIDMLPSPRCCIKLATLPSDTKRWVFCSSRLSAKTLLEHCHANGISTELFDFATFEDTPAQTLAKILADAKYIVGAAAFVAPAGVLHQRYGQFLQPDCEVIAIDRILAPHSIAAINQWLTARLQSEAHSHARCPMRENYERLKQEVTERKHIQERLEYENNHDELTGLYNRRFLTSAIDRLAGTGCLPLAVISIDLDRLKHINDTYGHHEGDSAIIEAASIISRCTGSNGIVARVGGDEFVALLPNTTEAELRRIIASLFEEARKSNSQNRRFPISLSVGYAISESYVPPRQLIKTADEAMYKDKISSSKSTLEQA